MSFSELSTGVISVGLCTRCGLCAGVCPVRVISLDKDNYPVLRGKCVDCGFCSNCCPGADVDFPLLFQRVFQADYDSENLHGHVERLGVAYANLEPIRSIGTSGGLVTALLVSLLENEKIDGALVAGFHPDNPCQMSGVLATTSEEIKNAAGSKYCLTSSLEALQLIRRRKGKYAVVGLPCQVQGLRKLEQVDPSLFRKIYCIFGLYCHCNMEPHVQLDVLRTCHIDPDNVARFDFRGGGWPGGFQVQLKDSTTVPLHTTLYTTQLNILFKIYGAKRCYMCVDALSEFADLSFGDFWAHDYTGEYANYTQATLLSQRTPLGMKIVQEAIDDGAISFHSLPRERASKRITNMAKGKKGRSMVRIGRRKKTGQAYPHYHFQSLTPSAKARRHERILRFFSLFRGSVARKIVLRFLFSRAANVYEKGNLFRKKLFCNFHGN